MAEVKAGTLNEVLSFFNPEIKKVINYLMRFVPKTSSLRSGAVVRALGVLASFIETRAGKVKNPVLSAIVEKSSDFVEILADELGEKQGRSTKKGGRFEATERIRDAFVAKIMQRIQKSQNPEEEVKKIKKEFELFDKLMSELEKPTEDQDKDEKEVNKSIGEIWKSSWFRKALKNAGRKITKAFKGIVKFFDGTVIPGLEELWDAANQILSVVIIGLLLAPFAIAFAAIIGVPWIVSLLTLGLMLLAILTLIGMIKPVLFGIAWLIPPVRAALRKVAAILGIELFVGVYFSFMSYFLKTSSIPAILLLVFTVFFLSVARQGGFVRTARAIALFLLMLVSLGSVTSCLFPRMFFQLPEQLAVFGIFSEKTGSEENLADQVVWLQEKWDDETKAKITSVQQDYEDGKITLKATLLKTKLIQEESENFRRELSKKPATTTTATTATNSTPQTSASRPKEVQYLDFKTYDVPMGGWSNTIRATLYSHYDVRVTGRAVIKFSDGYTDTLNTGGGHGFGQRAGVFQLLALEKRVTASVGQYN